jgi:8-oxo-dGTP pyrophosphatase MutT (NUDIX family)
MSYEHRIAAGGIVISRGKILLVRYVDGNGSYLVAPGGAIEAGESLAAAAEREVEEETSIKCMARAPVMIENLCSTRYQMVKIWYLCDYIDGDPVKTVSAEKEGIIEVSWFGDDELRSEVVFPDIIQAMKITALSNLRSGIIDPGVRTLA